MSEREKVVSEIVGRIYMAGAFSDKPMADKAEAELLALLRPSDAVGWVHRHQLALLNNPKTIGIEAMVYRHEPKAYDPPGAFVPLYLNPPTREREALQKLRELGTEGVYVALEYFRGVWSLEARSEETADVVCRTDGMDDPVDAILGAEDER